MSFEIQNLLRNNLLAIQDRIAQACARAGRKPEEVTLVAVTKYAGLESVRQLVELGQLDLGEARPQQLASRSRELAPTVRWHLIGHLQRNKAEETLATTHLIHSVDSLRLFEHLAKLGQKHQNRPAILLEVNVSGETSKDGFDPQELLAAWPGMQACESLQISGLMTMAPHDDDAEAARPVFRRLRSLRDQLRDQSNRKWMLSELSMGMSGDFEIGIEEGATIVRIGSRLFEGLPGE